MRQCNGVIVVVVVCAAFGLTVSEAKTEVICLPTKEMPESTVIFSVDAAGQVYNRIHTQRMVQLPEVHPRTVRPTERSPRAQNSDVLETMLSGCVTWSPRACHYDTLRRAHHRFLARCIGWRKHNRTDHSVSYIWTRL